MSIVIPEDIMQSARLTTAEMLQELAIALFQRDKLSMGQASRLAAISQWQFQQLLSSRGISPHYDVAEFEADLQTLSEIKGKDDSMAKIAEYWGDAKIDDIDARITGWKKDGHHQNHLEGSVC